MNSEGKTRRFLWITMVIILTGLAAFGLVVLILRSGGIIRILAGLLTLVVLYAGYEIVRAINRK